MLILRTSTVSTDLSFDYMRLHFPVALAFPITINKAQGQSLSVAGFNLQNFWFLHKQFYVAYSRVRTPKNVYVYTFRKNLKILFIRKYQDKKLINKQNIFFSYDLTKCIFLVQYNTRAICYVLNFFKIILKIYVAQY